MRKECDYAMFFGWFAFGVGVLLFLAVNGAGAQQSDCVFGSFGCGHEMNHDKYQGLRRPPNDLQPKGMDCCAGGDCRPTKVRGNKEDGYEWWDGEVWVPAPDYALLPADVIGDGRAHVCAPRPYEGQPARDRYTYCLSPSEPKI